MTLRRLLMSGGGTAVIAPTDPPDGGGGTPGDDGFPTTTDPTTLALRPTNVRTLATATATPGDDISTHVLDLAAELDTLTETPYGAEGPDHAAVLFLPPGEYIGGFGTGRWLSIVGTTGNPEDVVIFSDTIEADGVMHPYSPVYVEGVTLKGAWNPTLDQSPKYAAHIAGTARTTYVNVIFDVTEAHIDSAADSTWGNAGSVGMDGGAGTVLTFYGCTFLDVTGQSRLGMNLHGGPAADVGITVAFIDCTAPKGVGYSHGATGGADDELYVIGGNIGGSIQASEQVHVYTDLPNAVTGAETTTRDHTSWPIATQYGLTPFWVDFFYPTSLTQTGTLIARADVTDTAPMTPVAGRTYYCPIPVETGMHFNRYGLQVHAGTGKAVTYRPQPDPGVPGNVATANAPSPDTMSGGASLTTGQWLVDFFFSWMRYPATSAGGTRMWFHFKMADTTGASIDGSASLPGLHDCYYSDDDGTTLVKATAGTPFPLAHAAQVR